MEKNKELLQKVKELNIAENYSEVIQLLTDNSLEDLNDEELYAEKARAHFYLKEYELSEKNTDASLQINPYQSIANHLKGVIYEIHKKYDEAIIYFNKAIEFDPNYVYSYYGLGNEYYFLKDYQKALEYYSKAINIDPKFATSYYARALVYQQLNEYKKALTEFESFIEITEEKSSYYALQAQSRIEELEKSIASNDYSNVERLVKKIKEILLFKGNFITHYTGLSASKFMIIDESKFRLSECAFLNDSSEGRELFRFLNIQRKQERNKEDNNATPFTRKPFIGSFVSDLKSDDLTLWRMYGKEKKEEANGCSITIDCKKLQDSIKENVLSKKDNVHETISDDFNFYMMVYKTLDSKKPFIIPCGGNEEDNLNICMKELSKMVGNYIANSDKKHYNFKDLIELLNSIAYLFKSAEYQYEHEIRMVINGIGFEKIINSDFAPCRVYLETVSINPFIDKITLGPKVYKVEEWAAAFYYKLDKQGYRPDIYISHLPFK